MGRPRKIETAKDMERAIKKYFKSCEGKLLKDKDGRPVIVKGFPVVVGAHPPTVTGLARAMGLGSRQSLLNYQGREEFAVLVEDAKARVMEYAEERLYDRDGARGAEFNLRFNFGWGAEATQDKEGGGVVVLSPVETDQEAGGASPSPTGTDEGESGPLPTAAPTDGKGEGEYEKCRSDPGVGAGSGTVLQEDPGPGTGAGGFATGDGGAEGGER